MSRVVHLHIGAPKTGTTYLQHRLSRNVKSLARHDVHFPTRNPLVSPELFQFRAALDLLDAWATGHPGGVATLHATTIPGALLRLDRLAQRAGVPTQRALIGDAVQLVVLLQNTNTHGAAARRVTDLVRVTGLTEDGRYVLHRCTERGTWEAI